MVTSIRCVWIAIAHEYVKEIKEHLRGVSEGAAPFNLYPEWSVRIDLGGNEGLLVPVVRFADNKSLSHISVEVKELATKAINKQLQPADWEGNTFTISNLGMFGIEEFTAIINPPDACILAIGGIKQTPIVKDGQVVPGNVMKVTLSCDHRAVDGAVGAAFLKTLKGLLEDPVRILI